MKRWLRILLLRHAEFWQEILADVERGRIHDASRSLAEMERRLAKTRFELDRLHAPQSVIMQALQRRSKQ